MFDVASFPFVLAKKVVKNIKPAWQRPHKSSINLPNASATRRISLRAWARICRQWSATQKMRGSGPFVFAQVKHGVGVDHIIVTVIHAWQHASAIPHGK
jgi:hypothetical protein